MNSVSQHIGSVSTSKSMLQTGSHEHHDGSLQIILLSCGIISSVLYVAMDVIGTIGYGGYSYIDHTFSELMASGSPVRPFMILLDTLPYTLLMVAFAMGVRNSAGRKGAARITAALLGGYAIIGMLTAIVFPMHTRAALAAGEAGLRSAMHPIGTMVMSLFLLLAMGFAATLLGRRFRYYTYATIIVLLVFGILTSLQAGDMMVNLATPWMGIEERINIYATMLWIAVFGLELKRAGAVQSPESKAAGKPEPRRWREMYQSTSREEISSKA